MDHSLGTAAAQHFALPLNRSSVAFKALYERQLNWTFQQLFLHKGAKR